MATNCDIRWIDLHSRTSELLVLSSALPTSSNLVQYSTARPMGVCCSAGYCSELWGCDCYHCCDDCCGCCYYCFDDDRYHRNYPPGHPAYGPGYGPQLVGGPLPPQGYGFPRPRGFPRLWGGCQFISSILCECTLSDTTLLLSNQTILTHLNRHSRSDLL